MSSDNLISQSNCILTHMSLNFNCRKPKYTTEYEMCGGCNISYFHTLKLFVASEYFINLHK